MNGIYGWQSNEVAVGISCICIFGIPKIYRSPSLVLPRIAIFGKAAVFLDNAVGKNGKIAGYSQ